MLVESIIFLAVVALVAVVGIRIGMLVARPIERVAGDPDEEPSVDD